MNILFQTGFERGNFDDFDLVSTSGLTSRFVQSEIVHSGRYAAKLTVMPLWFLAYPGVRLVWQAKHIAPHGYPANLPDSAYYGAWYYLPEHVETPWLNLMQWKQALVLPNGSQTRDPVASVRILGKDGRMTLNLRHRADDFGEYIEDGPVVANDDTPLPIGEWFEISTLYEWSPLPVGRVATWLNGQPLWDIGGIRTEFTRPYLTHPRQVTWNNYAGDIRPRRYGLYIDDVRVWSE